MDDGFHEKVEVSFKICQVKGITGSQGVIIPKGNVPHLMLDENVIQAVTNGKFHIWLIKTVDEGLELLTGQDPNSRMMEPTRRAP